MDFKYEINAKNELQVWDSVNAEPFLHQPHYPNGDSWTKAQAKEWAEIFVTSLKDDTAPLAGPSADELTVTRPEPVVLTNPLAEQSEESDAPTES